MKQKILSLGALLVVAVFAFAFKAEPLKRVNTLWVLQAGGNPNNPNHYTPFSGSPATACPQSAFVCVIDIPEVDLYADDDPSFPGKPRVINTSATGELADDIATALSNVSDPTTFTATGRIIYERGVQ